MVMYEIWSLGKKPFSELTPMEVSMSKIVLFIFQSNHKLIIVDSL